MRLRMNGAPGVGYFRVIRHSSISRSFPLSSTRKCRCTRTRPPSSRCARATVLRPGRSGSRAVAHSTMFAPSNVPSLWRIDIDVFCESYHTVVNRLVCESKPEIPVPVLLLPSVSKKTKSDCRNLPSWIMYCLHVPLVTTGAPLAGKNVLTMSQSPANCASSFCPAPGELGGSYSLWVCCATANGAKSKAAIIHFFIALPLLGCGIDYHIFSGPLPAEDGFARCGGFVQATHPG